METTLLLLGYTAILILPTLVGFVAPTTSAVMAIGMETILVDLIEDVTIDSPSV